MNVNKLTMCIEDPVLDAKYKNQLYERTTKVIPFISLFKFWLFDQKNGAPYVSLGTDSVVSKNKHIRIRKYFSVRNLFKISKSISSFLTLLKISV